MLDRGALVNLKEKYRGETALMWAAAERHPAAVKALIEKGASREDYAEQAVAYAERYEVHTYVSYVATTRAWLRLRSGDWAEAESATGLVADDVVRFGIRTLTQLDEVIARADKEKIVSRLWKRDASLWKSDEAHAKIIANSLGWLDAPQRVDADRADALFAACAAAAVVIAAGELVSPHHDQDAARDFALGMVTPPAPSKPRFLEEVARSTLVLRHAFPQERPTGRSGTASAGSGKSAVAEVPSFFRGDSCASAVFSPPVRRRTGTARGAKPRPPWPRSGPRGA